MKLQDVMQQEESLAEFGSLSERSTARSNHSSAWGSEVSSIGSDTGIGLIAELCERVHALVRKPFCLVLRAPLSMQSCFTHCLFVCLFVCLHGSEIISLEFFYRLGTRSPGYWAHAVGSVSAEEPPRP
jgi:hypothetical protein